MTEVDSRLSGGPSTRAMELLRGAFSCDLHGCMPMRPEDEAFLPQLARYRAAGVKLVFLNVGWDVVSIEQHVKMLAHFRSWIQRHPDDYVLATTMSSIAQAIADGKLAVAFDIEGMNAIGDQLALLSLYHDLGVRWMGLVYNRQNLVGGGCQEEDKGLTVFGRAVVSEMAHVGMMLCCSHAGKRTALEAIDISPNPVMFSHSNAAALHAHARNIDDETIRACAGRGGVIGINGIGRFLGEGPDVVRLFVDHIDHITQAVGPEHVGIGLDYVFDVEELLAYVARFPETYPPEQYRAGHVAVQPEHLPEIVDALIRRGYADSAVQAILGGNFRRVAEAVWC